jgi:isopentenyldiphosphate isomerase
MAPAEEQIDVLSASGSKTGASVPRSQVHRDGLWHRSTHVWVAARHERSVLLQKRSAEKDTFPGRWDVSAAGHVSAGAESAETARRELAEELGVNGPVDYLFTARAQATGVENGVAFVDREFQDVYLFAGGDVDLGAVVMQPEEVDEVRYWNVDDYRRALEEKDDRFVPRSPDYLARLLLWFDSHMPATSSH